MAGDCGDCTACCRVFAIPELNKKASDWCQHCAIGKGCTIYPTRPDPCVSFKCLWLLSQHQENLQERMPVELRPDKSKVVLSPTTNAHVLSAMTMPGSPLAWQSGPIHKWIKTLALRGLQIAIGPPASTRRTMFRFELGKFIASEVEMTEPDENGMQWNKRT